MMLNSSCLKNVMQVTVDGPREPRSNKSKFKSFLRKISSMNNSPELPYALSEDGGDEDMQDGGNDITDDDYTPSVLPTSPIGILPRSGWYFL